jgi:hypothetical protein
MHILAHGGAPKDKVNEGSLGTQCGSHSYIQCMPEGSYKLSHPSHHHSRVTCVKTFLKLGNKPLSIQGQKLEISAHQK